MRTTTGIRGLLLISLTASVWNAPLTAGSVYKWTDARGRVHYSDRPADADSGSVKIRPAPQPPLAAVQERRIRQQKLLRAFDEEREIDRQKAAKAREDKRLRADNCASARQTLEAYRDARYLYDEDADGERRILSHAERTQATEKMRQAVEYWCGKT
jgi:hypothetical protein